MNIAVVGSRNWPDPKFVYQRLKEAALEAQAIEEPLRIVSGGARGVDTMAANWARAASVDLVEYPADWQRYGRSAGYRRNNDIVNAADIVIAFQIGGSKGTQHSIDLARQQGKPVAVYTERDLSA